MWLEDYANAFRSGYAKAPSPEKLSELRESIAQAQQTFFTSGSRFELNVTPEYVTKMSELAQTAELVPPDEFKDLREQVENMLNESFHRFVMGCMTNSGTARGIFGIFVGVCAMSVALAPLLLSILGGRSRWIRFAALPCLWLGITTIIGCLHGVRRIFSRLRHDSDDHLKICIVIYLFGDARQLYPYELARPCSSPTPTERNAEMVPELKTSPSLSHYDEDVKGIVVSPSIRPESPTKALSTPGSSPPPTSAGFISPFLYTQQLYRSDSDATPTTSSSPATIFDFDALPPPSAHLSPEALAGKAKRDKVPTFTPLTKILSPEITRAQWEIMVRSAILGLILAIALGAACIAVPAKH